ncbi:hypothetical protein KDY119_02614 [Luteimicrobium xylanilyticum]|uniref:ABC-2 type transporter transmembrane domain-containing protein n=1 Tax=Luteimicrobium xylanilyticum TaxID=1133546 RepID=A0A5P9QCA5_9MICO|nr:hypothetical protein KDY119_02614 [Luteimicrobium xylanilyticum]
MSEQSSEALRQIAVSAGLAPMGVRPPLGQYLRDLWSRRAFLWELSSSKAYARNRNSYLGQAWSVLTPLLSAAVYIIIFGIVLNTTRGVENAIGFILVGTFMFRFFEHAVSGGGKAIRGNTSLVRAVRFPRAVLPISVVLSELVTLGPALVVMLVVTYLSGLGEFPKFAYVPVSWRWLLLPLAIMLLAFFNVGCAFIMARWVARAPDIQNLIGFVMRFVMYASGVIFSIDHYFKDHPGVGWVLQRQPVAVYLELTRACVLHEPTIPLTWQTWAWGVGWAALFAIGGFLYFWRGEERYGRD